MKLESKVGMKLPFGEETTDPSSKYGDNILPGSSIASITWPGNRRVYFQDKLGGIREGVYSDGEWAGGHTELFTAKLYTPLAIITWDNGKQVPTYINEGKRDPSSQKPCYRFAYTILTKRTGFKSTPLPLELAGTMAASQTSEFKLLISLELPRSGWQMAQ